MAPGMGIKAPVPRTRTGCLTCRKRKVKCDEGKPNCNRCLRLQRECTWGDDLQVVPQRRQDRGSATGIKIVTTASKTPALRLSTPSGQNFVLEFPSIDRATIPYLHHFATFCTRFIAYPCDSEMNPFQEELVPSAVASPALLNAMAALGASHLSRTQKQHNIPAAKYYSVALREMNNTLSDPDLARLDATLAACLILCVYEISHSENYLWQKHLEGARDLILFRGGPRSQSYLTRFFSLLDISGSLASGSGTLLEGNYWLDSGLEAEKNEPQKVLRWPYYDDEAIMTSHYHELMTYMAKLSHLSAESMSDFGRENPDVIIHKGTVIEKELQEWWRNCPSVLTDQRTDWRRIPRERKLTVAETLEEESFSSFHVCISGCYLYLYHILDPVGRYPQRPEAARAIATTLEVASEIPEGYGLEMVIYWGLFMAGVSVFNDFVAEDLLRRKLTADASISIYHAERALKLLEVLWKRQHQYKRKYDWRELQNQMGIQVFIFT